MFNLKNVLVAKIIITISAWALPLLLFPIELLVFLGFPEPQPEIFIRLLGTAYSALVVGYLIGYQKSKSDSYPFEAVWVGIVSNGGATIVLSIAAFYGSWLSWGTFAQFYMWLSLLSVALITAGLIYYGPCRTDNGPVQINKAA